MKTSKPRLNIIEHVAAELAGTFYEIGRSQGLKSKHKTARQYAAANLEKFVPHAIKHLMDILGSPSASAEMKEEIWDCIQERMNDPAAQSLSDASDGYALPDIDIAKLIPVKELPTVIQDKRAAVDFGVNAAAINPFKAKRH